MTERVEVTPSVQIKITYGPGETVVRDFHDWMQQTGIYPIGGSGSSAPPLRYQRGGPLHDGQWYGAFDADDWPEVKAWLEQRLEMKL